MPYLVSNVQQSEERMYKPFNQFDALALAAIIALALFCRHYAQVDAQVEGSALAHIFGSLADIAGKTF